jgi:metal-dependent amidase/aminoacylase/carboxypeptidase family protein
MMRPIMGGEDFSAYQQVTPGTFLFVGAGNKEKGISAPHHHPRFTVDEDALGERSKNVRPYDVQSAGRGDRR